MSQISGNNSRIQAKEESELHVAALDNARTQHCLKLILSVYKSSFGPNGKVKALHNNSEGYVTLTSSSSRLLQSLSVNNPLVRVINTSIQGHLSSYSDGGLFTGILALILIENSATLPMNRRLLTNLYDMFLSKCVDYLKSPLFPAKFTLAFNNIDMLITEIKSIFRSKWLSCGITLLKEDFFARLLLKSFLQVFPNSATDSGLQDLQFLTIDGEQLENSHLVNGVLFEASNLPLYKVNPLLVNSRKINNKLSVAMICVSMSGDSEEFVDAQYELENDKDIGKITIEHCQRYVEQLIQLEVQVVCCQRVMHPRIKKLLRHDGILAVDRLGLMTFQSLLKLTGAVTIGSFTSPANHKHFGWLHDVEHIILHGKSFIHFKHESSSICTLVLCSTSEQQVLELKATAKSCLETLFQQTMDPRLLCGGGCWLSVLNKWIKLQVMTQAKEWCSIIGCTQQQLNLGVKTFIHSIYQVISLLGKPSGDHLVDTKHGHFWSFPANTVIGHDWSCLKDTRCQCGLVSNENDEICFEFLQTEDRIETLKESGNMNNLAFAEIVNSSTFSKVQCVDSFLPFLNGFQTAILTSCMLLSVKNYICDTN